MGRERRGVEGRVGRRGGYERVGKGAKGRGGEGVRRSGQSMYIPLLSVKATGVMCTRTTQ